MPTREEMQSLAQDIVRSYEERIAGIAQLREAVKVDLREFQGSRTAMSKELKADLAKVRRTLAEQDRKREGDAREFKGELARAVAEGKAVVKAQLSEFDSTHKAMGREMRAELARGCLALAEGEKKRQSEAREFKGELARVVAEGKAATQARLKELAEVEAGARDEWQRLSATMQAKRGVLVVERPPETAAPPAPEEVAALRDGVFKYLAGHPDGTRLVELEREFKMARVQMARLIRGLQEENKVEKRDLLYFAVNANSFRANAQGG